LGTLWASGALWPGWTSGATITITSLITFLRNEKRADAAGAFLSHYLITGFELWKLRF